MNKTTLFVIGAAVVGGVAFYLYRNRPSSQAIAGADLGLATPTGGATTAAVDGIVAAASQAVSNAFGSGQGAGAAGVNSPMGGTTDNSRLFDPYTQETYYGPLNQDLTGR